MALRDLPWATILFSGVIAALAFGAMRFIQVRRFYRDLKSATRSSRPPHQNAYARFNTRYLNHLMLKMDARELAIQSAIRDLESGVYTSQRAAAKAWGVPQSTLQDRLDGRQPRAIAHQHQQRLSPEQEEFLIN
ncbi:hypothetical protein G6011_02071 [Alternaria panax]|uniref:HTH psq-type domain-containing protein n=1 Tax=Alternaria panax TaxID=48097 RepID=A0AAD4FFT6_9PLEO|nr:hypothetical protein G6011_02071 [Alternaria panax]